MLQKCCNQMKLIRKERGVDNRQRKKHTHTHGKKQHLIWMIALTLSAHQPWPMSASAFLLLWNMTADYLACLAMKLLCFVFSSRGGCGGGVGMFGCQWGVQGHDCVKGIIEGNREGELGWEERRWEGAGERETKSLGDPTNLRDCWGADGNINHVNCLMNFWWVFYKLKAYYLKSEQYSSDYARRVQQTTSFTGTDSEESVSLPSAAQALWTSGCKIWYSEVWHRYVRLQTSPVILVKSRPIVRHLLFIAYLWYNIKKFNFVSLANAVWEKLQWNASQLDLIPIGSLHWRITEIRSVRPVLLYLNWKASTSKFTYLRLSRNQSRWCDPIRIQPPDALRDITSSN